MRLTISLPCYNRPQRTKRAIECIMNQNINGWEAIIGGDCCPNVQSLMESGYFRDLQQTCVQRGNTLIAYNLPTNNKGFGYAITNKNIQMASGKYFIFFANDDVIKENHFQNYLTPMEQDDSIDLGIFPTLLEPFQGVKPPMLLLGSVGHSQLIVKSELAKEVPPHSPNYDHDWVFIQNLIQVGANVKLFETEATYVVKSVPAKLEVGID